VLYTSSWWALETAGWSVDASGESTAFIPCDTEEEAALVVSAFRKPDGTIAPEELWEMSGKASPSNAARSPVRCGDFQGYSASYEEEGVHWRIWWLAHGAMHIYATFNCQPSDAGKHDAVLDWMLSSLRALPHAG
jgi:hypothetical protein